MIQVDCRAPNCCPFGDCQKRLIKKQKTVELLLEISGSLIEDYLTVSMDVHSFEMTNVLETNRM